MSNTPKPKQTLLRSVPPTPFASRNQFKNTLSVTNTDRDSRDGTASSTFNVIRNGKPLVES